MPIRSLTRTQQNSLHKYCEMLAGALNDAGYEMKAVLQVKSVDVPWSRDRVKEVLWRPIQEAMTGKGSTTELDRLEPSQVYEVLNRHIASHFGVSVPWPSEESDERTSRGIPISRHA